MANRRLRTRIPCHFLFPGPRLQTSQRVRPNLSRLGRRGMQLLPRCSPKVLSQGKILPLPGHGLVHCCLPDRCRLDRENSFLSPSFCAHVRSRTLQCSPLLTRIHLVPTGVQDSGWDRLDILWDSPPWM